MQVVRLHLRLADSTNKKCLKCLWESSGLAGRLELKPYGSVESWPDE